MGQRTQIIVIKENNKGEVRKTVWHHQWGFGRNMYLALISLHIADYSKDTWDKDYDFFNTSFPTIPKLYNVTDEIPKDILEQANVDSLASIKRVFDYCDNNNGGLVIQIKENPTENYNPSEFKIGFLMGYEDEYEKSVDGKEVYNKENIGERPFSRWLTPVEYGRINGGKKCSDVDFIEMIYKYCEYFNIETFKNTKTPEEVNKEYKELCEKEKNHSDTNNQNEVAMDDSEEIDDRKVFGVYPHAPIYEDGEVIRVKLMNGKVYFFQDLYNCGWYTRDELCPEVAEYIEDITDEEIIRRIKTLEQGKKNEK